MTKTTKKRAKRSAVKKAVRQQYEALPYPARDPADENKRLLICATDRLAKINHYCYAGRQGFRSGFRTLVAGGGTGDAVLFLAEQLRDTDAKVVHLDVSRASTQIAQQRARVRRLSNIEWVVGSLLDLPKMELGKFDYINCYGVLHHLDDAAEGLASLQGVLNSDGAMCVMLYGKYARCGIYQMQELMGLIDSDEADMGVKLQDAKTILGNLPPTNWFKRGQEMFGDVLKSDAALYDCLLHAKDTAFSVAEACELFERCGLNVIDLAERKVFYRPETYIKDAELLAKIKQLPKPQQQTIAEIISGAMRKHTFYLCSGQADRVVRLDQPDVVPFFCEAGVAPKIYETIKNVPAGKTVQLTCQSVTFNMRLGKFTKYIFKNLDGERTVDEIVSRVRNERKFTGSRPAESEIFNDLGLIYTTLNMVDFMFLRDKSVGPFESTQQLQMPVTERSSAK